MGKKNKMCYSGVGGQAVLEGVMMKNKDRYAVAVRKPDGNIEVEIENYQGIVKSSVVQKIPLVRGVVNFIDSLVLGTKSLNYSASFYEEDVEETKFDKFLNKITRGKAEEVLTTFVMILSIALAVDWICDVNALICLVSNSRRSCRSFGTYSKAISFSQ